MYALVDATFIADFIDEFVRADEDDRLVEEDELEDWPLSASQPHQHLH
jgi:hypothetical protein